MSTFYPAEARATTTIPNNIDTARELYRKGQYFLSARVAFATLGTSSASRAEAYSWITLSLAKARLYNSASYFFIRTLQTKNRSAIRRVLRESENLIFRVGADLFRKYIVKYTEESDYSDENRSAVMYILGKDALLVGKADLAVQFLDRVDRSSPIYPYALQIRGSSHATLGNASKAVRDYRRCEDLATDIVSRLERSDELTEVFKQRQRRSALDLQARCQAGRARTFYQERRFIRAERAYDEIEKDSFVWTDILFEQAWNAYSKGEFNRALGKLVTYKNPSLNFVFNTEVDVLRAQSFLALCLYEDANEVINEFNGRYAGIGKRIKRFLEKSRSLTSYYQFGKSALRDKLHSEKLLHRLANRFVRSPYFQSLVSNEKAIEAERRALGRFDQSTRGQRVSKQGLPGFLRLVLKWRQKTIDLIGGAFVKNSLIDYYAVILDDFEKIAFIKLEVLKRAKERLQRIRRSGRVRGNVIPTRRDDQFYWSFNGEFWSDELGDYVFGLESQCRS